MLDNFQKRQFRLYLHLNKLKTPLCHFQTLQFHHKMRYKDLLLLQFRPLTQLICPFLLILLYLYFLLHLSQFVLYIYQVSSYMFFLILFKFDFKERSVILLPSFKIKPAIKSSFISNIISLFFIRGNRSLISSICSFVNLYDEINVTTFDSSPSLRNKNFLRSSFRRGLIFIQTGIFW